MDRFGKISVVGLLTLLHLFTGWWPVWLLFCSGFGVLRFGIKVKGVIAFFLLVAVSPAIWALCGYGVVDYSRFAFGTVAIFVVMRSVAS